MLRRLVVSIAAAVLSAPLFALQVDYARTYELEYRVAPAPSSEGSLYMLGVEYLPEAQRPEAVRHPAYHADEPTFLLVPGIGDGAARWATLDTAGPESAFQDRLYFDSDGDNDLTDEEPLTARTLPADEDTPARYAVFPPVPVEATVEGNTRQHHVAIAITYGVGDAADDVRPMVVMVGAAYREGRVELGGKLVRVAVIDTDLDGRFDERAVARGDGSYPEPGDAVVISEQVNEPIVLEALDFGHARMLGRYVCHDGECYQIRVAPDGSSVKVYALRPDVGVLRAAQPGAVLHLVGEDGAVGVATGPDGAHVPVGTYTPMFYVLGETDERGRKWLLLCAPYMAVFGETFDVEAGASREIVFGPPLEWHLSVLKESATSMPRGGDVVADAEPWGVSLSLSVSGQGETRVAGVMVDGEQPPPPTFRILDEAGEVVHEDQFEYG